MRLYFAQDARQQQNQRIDPRQILASDILTWNTEEMEAAIARELAENPALESRDGEGLSALGDSTAFPLRPPLPLTDGEEMVRFSSGALRTEFVQHSEIPGNASAVSSSSGLSSEADPLDFVASGISLRDHLRAQIWQTTTDSPTRVAVAYLIECLDERGYLVGDCAEIAEHLGATASFVEGAIRALQAMEPAGVGARDLRECLLLQVNHFEQMNEAHPLARTVLSRCWSELTARREERIATRLRVSAGEVRAALRFIRTSLSPHPGADFRPEWSSRAGSSGSRMDCAPVRPDVRFHHTESGFSVELTRDFEAALIIAPHWKCLTETTAGAGRDAATRRYIGDHVDRAQAFLVGVSRRGQTLRRIAGALTELQSGYLVTGDRAFLRPLTRQSLAEALETDESVISRAVAGKWAQIPCGDVVPLDSFFGSAHAVREALASLIEAEDPQSPYSDDEIASLLSAKGFPLARRTVAKYRSLEKILPARLRRRTLSLPVPQSETGERQKINN